MGARLNRFYQLVSADDFLEIAESLPRIEWVVEAGVHDAADTVEIYKRIKPREYIGFEPDLVAHLRAVKRLEESHLKEKVSLFQMALSDKEESISLVTPTSLGAG